MNARNDKPGTWFDTLILGIALCIIGISVGVVAGMQFPHFHASCHAFASAITRIDVSMILPTMALFYLCNYWVTHPVVPAKRS
jgi:hypothetical protein